MNLSIIDTLFYLVSNLFRTFVIIKFIEIFFKEQTSSNKMKFCIFLLFYITNSLLYLVFSNPFINLFSNLFFVYIFTLLYKSKFWLRIGSILLVYSINMLLDQLTYDFLLILKLDTHTPIYTSIISNILLYMFILVLNRILEKRFMSTLTFIQSIVIFTIPSGSILILLIIFSQNLNYVGTLMISSFLFLMNIIVFYFYDIIGQYYADQQMKELLARQNLVYFNEFTLIKASDNNLRQLKHDFKNHILSLQRLLKNNQTNTVERYLNDLYQFTQLDSQYVSSLNQHVNSILNYKLREAAILGTIITCNLSIPEHLNISAFYLNIILGNLLDNALEALQTSKRKELFIDIQLEKNILYIDVSNSYTGIIRQKKSKILTSKLDSSAHGLGLESIKSVVKKYAGDMEISYDDTTFNVNIVICNFKI